MPGKPDKPHRIRVRTLDGKPRDQGAINQLRSGPLGTFFHFVDATGRIEFVICADSQRQIDSLRPKLVGAGFEEIADGDTAIAMPAQQNRQRSGQHQRGGGQQHPQHGDQPAAQTNRLQPLPGKPYDFVSLPIEFTTSPPVWHDGTSTNNRLSGEIRFELETLTPLLVGWERGQVGDTESDWPVPAHLANRKSVLCPLRAPWGKRPVIIPGDSLKGLLRHELGALLGAPMARTSANTFKLKQKEGRYKREGLPSLDNPHDPSDSPISNLMGYVSGDDLMMGHVSLNSALEVIADEDNEARFEPPMFLKVLGAPDHRIGKYYLKKPLPSTEGPALLSGTVAGRKFYLDRSAEIDKRPWKDDSQKNREDDQSTLALEASKPGRKFRFTVRFRDLEASELAAILVALCPNQFKGMLGGTHKDGYCSKLGYARPLGWGSVRIKAMTLLLLDEVGYAPALNPEADLNAWVAKNHRGTATQEEWLAIHRFKHPDAADYPKPKMKHGGRR